MTQVFGHRGSAGTQPENTMISFQEAIRVGADGIELDVHVTKDDVIVVIHDEKVDRTTNGKGFVKDHTYKEIRKLDARYKFNAIRKPVSIPSLEEVLEWAKAQNILVNIELKNNVLPYYGLEEKVIAICSRYNMMHRVIFSSFNHYSVQRLSHLAPGTQAGILYSSQLVNPWDYAKKIVGATALHPSRLAINDEMVIHAQRQNLPVRPYTINGEDEMRRLFAIQCSAIITDYPEKAVFIKNGN